MATTWDPRQYLQFENERTRPLRELLARVPQLPDPPTILDIGCGPGNSTAEIRNHWPTARITGIDNSPDMLATARTTQGEPTADYLLADASHYDPTPTEPDLIVSNALLHWIPAHLTLLPRWIQTLKPGGVLAFQVPGNFDSPSHLLLAELRRSARWRDLLGHDHPRHPVHQPAEYLAALLDAHSTPDVWETTYSTLLTGPDPVLEWTKGTTLRPILGRLTDPADRAAFLTQYATLLRDAYPPGPHGTVFPFRRIFAIAVR